MTSVQYSGAAVPLGGIGQFAGTWPGQPTVASPLNAIRNGSGKYWTSVDYQAGQNSPGQARPMSSFRRNMWTLQSPFIGQGAILQNPNPVIQADEINMQGPAYYAINVQTAKSINLYVAPGGGIYGGTSTGTGGVGGSGASYGTPTVISSGYPGGGGGNATQVALTVQGSGVVIYNYGSIYGAGGGGGGATPGQFPGTVYPGGYPNQAGQATGQPYYGGQGAAMFRLPAPGQPGPGPGQFYVGIYGGPGGNGGQYGQAGGGGGQGYVQWVLATDQRQNRGTAGGGGNAAAAVSAPTVQYVVAGAHN